MYIYFNCIVQDSLYHNVDIGNMWVHWSASPYYNLWDCCFFVCLFFWCALFWCWVSLCAPFTISSISSLFWSWYLWLLLGSLWSRWSNLVVLVLQMCNSLDVSATGHSPWILAWTCYLQTPLCHVCIPYSDILQGVPSFATDCHCGVRWLELTTCLLYVGLLFGKLI